MYSLQLYECAFASARGKSTDPPTRVSLFSPALSTADIHDVVSPRIDWQLSTGRPDLSPPLWPLTFDSTRSAPRLAAYLLFDPLLRVAVVMQSPTLRDMPSFDENDFDGLTIEEWRAMSDEDRMEYQRLRRRDAAFRTKLCNLYKSETGCPWGPQCRFAHGEQELNPPPMLHPKYKTELCRNFTGSGTCRYGARCQFIHRWTGKPSPRPEFGQSTPQPLPVGQSTPKRHPIGPIGTPVAPTASSRTPSQGLFASSRQYPYTLADSTNSSEFSACGEAPNLGTPGSSRSGLRSSSLFPTDLTELFKNWDQAELEKLAAAWKQPSDNKSAFSKSFR